jgi:hypothetical protein
MDTRFNFYTRSYEYFQRIDSVEFCFYVHRKEDGLSIEYRRVPQAGKVTFLQRCETVVHEVLVMWHTNSTRVTVRAAFNSFFLPQARLRLVFSSSTISVTYLKYKIYLI